MTISRAERLRTAERAEAEGVIREDTSEAVHAFADDWTIVRLTTCGDVRREGFLMSSCVPKYVGDKLISDSKPARYQPGTRGDEDRAEPVDVPLIHSTDLSGCNFGQSLHSLRDPMGLPHLTFWANETGAWDIFGHKNGKPKAKYLRRLGEWADSAEIKNIEGVTEKADSFKQFYDGYYTYEGVHFNRYYDTLHARALGADQHGDKYADTKRGRRQKVYHDQAWSIAWRTTLMIGRIHTLMTLIHEDRKWLKWKGESATERDRQIVERNRKLRRAAIHRCDTRLRRASIQLQQLTEAQLTPAQRRWYAGKTRCSEPIMTQGNDPLRERRRKGRRR